MSTQPGAGQQPGTFQPQGQPAYQTGGVPTPPPPPAAPARQRNTLAIVGLVVAVLGLVFAVMEGAYLLGWILLPAAFVLSIVALVVRDRPRRMAVAALIISIVGTIAGGIAFMSSTARILDESFGGGEATVVATPAASQEEAGDEDTTEQSAAAEDSSVAEEPAQQDAAPAGTRDNPHPLGTTIASDEWEVTVNSFTADATDEVMAENQFNDDPPAGTTYALVNVTVTRIAADEGIPWEITVAYVTDGGNVVNTSDALAVGPDELPSNELYEGADATGNVVLAVPADGSGTVRVTPGLFADDAFFATS